MKELFARHKKTLIITTILCLLPIVFGIAMWDKLPDPMPTHFDFEGVPNGWSSKAFAVFGIPLFLAACEWLCLLATGADPKRRNVPHKVLTLMLWLIPIIALISLSSVYAMALGAEMNTSQLQYPFFSLLFILVGNYLPKCRQSYTMGIKLPWTLASEENWNKTHRMAGPIWMLCGVATLPCFFLPRDFAVTLLFTALFTAIIIPTVYSFLLARKQGQI